MPGLEGRKLGSYRVMQRIGEGGMGAVYLAEHVDIGRRAALKVLRSELAHHAEQAARFLDEARATTRGFIAEAGRPAVRPRLRRTALAPAWRQGRARAARGRRN